MEQLLPLLANYGFGAIMAGVVVLLHWYTVKVTIPDLTKAFREELAAIRQRSYEDAKELREAIEHLATHVQIITRRDHA